MRLTPLFLAFATLAPISLAQAAKAPHAEKAPYTEKAPPVTEAMAPDEDEDDAKAPENESLIDYFWRKSDVAFHAGDYPRAIGLHRAIVVLDPTRVDSYGLGAWLLWSLGKNDEAVAFLQEGLKANPNDPEMWDTAAQQYDLQKLTTQSLEAYGKAVELAGKDADQMLRRRYAHSAEHAGDLAKSEEIWTALVADFPNDVVNKNNLERVQKQRADELKNVAGAHAV